MKKLLFTMFSGVLTLGLMSAAHADSSNPNGSGVAGKNTQIQEQRHSDGTAPQTGQQGMHNDKNRDNLNQQHGNQADQMRRDNSGSGQSQQPARQQ